MYVSAACEFVPFSPSSRHSLLLLLVTVSPVRLDEGRVCTRLVPGMPERLAREGSSEEPRRGSVYSFPEVQNAMNESHILEKMAAEAGQKRPGMKPIKGITE